MSGSRDLYSYTYTATSTTTATDKPLRDFHGTLIDIQTSMPSSCLPSTTLQVVDHSFVLATMIPLCPGDVATKRYIYEYTYDAVGFVETPTTSPRPTSTSVPIVLDEPEASENGGITTAQIVGIAIGCCVGFAILFVAAAFLSRGCRNWRKKPELKNESSVPALLKAVPGEMRTITLHGGSPALVGVIPKLVVPPGGFYDAVAATPPRGMLPGHIYEAPQEERVGVIRAVGTPSKNPTLGNFSAPPKLQAPRPSGWKAAAAARPLPPALESIEEDKLCGVAAQEAKGTRPV